MNKSTTAHKSTTVAYDSNPFATTFAGFERLFKLSQTAAIIILVVSLFGSFGQMFFRVGGMSPASRGATASPAPWNPSGGVIGLLVGLGIIGFLVMSVVSIFYTGIINFVAYKTSKGEPTTIPEAFQAVADKFWTITGVMFLSFLKVVGGLLLFIVPGIRAGLRYQMALFPVFDENLNARAAMKRIKELTRGHLMEVFGITGVGMLLFPVATLLQMGGEAVLYPGLKAVKDRGAPAPKTHWLNYLGFFILAGIFGFGLFIGLLVAILASNS